MIEPKAGVHRFQHRAMATIFELMIAGEEEAFASGAANEAFNAIDRLEQDLSRYLPNSDITRINNLRSTASVSVSADTFECLRLSKKFHEETLGAFDITTGALMDCWVAPDKSLRHPSSVEIDEASSRIGMDRLELDEASMSVHVRGLAPQIDLGAIGKGYAADCAAELLREWGVGAALLHGGTSSVYAFGDYPGCVGWPVTLSNPERRSEVLEKVFLKDQALGGSGIKKGRHIIDPRKGLPVEARRATWVLSESATRSDALSTACMILKSEEIAGLICRDKRLRALIVEANPLAVVRFGFSDVA
jgi:thiamine biosynthesis lipoprotein